MNSPPQASLPQNGVTWEPRRCAPTQMLTGILKLILHPGICLEDRKSLAWAKSCFSLSFALHFLMSCKQTSSETICNSRICFDCICWQHDIQQKTSFCSCTLFKLRAGNKAWIELCNFKCNWHLQKKISSTIDSRNAQVKATLGNFIIIETVITTLLIWIPLKIHVFGLQQSYLKRVSTVSLLWALISSDKLQRTKVIDFIKETKLNIKIMKNLKNPKRHWKLSMIPDICQCTKCTGII